MTVDMPSDFSSFEAVNHLWPSFVERHGLERSKRAVRQALDLQGMHAKEGVVPMVFVETCGVALASAVLLREQTGVNAHGDGMVVMASRRDKQLQVIWGDLKSSEASSVFA